MQPRKGGITVRRFVTVDAEIEVAGPVMVQSSEPGPWGVDAVCLRNASGHLVIPGSELLGLYRAGLEQLCVDPFHQVIGAPGGARSLAVDKAATGLMAEPLSDREVDEQNVSGRFPVWFSDAKTVHRWPAAGQNTVSMTAVDEETGAAQDMSLRTLDCPVPVGSSARFRMQVVAACPEDRLPQFMDVLHAFLTAGLNYVGSHRTIGFGEVLSAVILGVTDYSPAQPVPMRFHHGFARAIDSLFPASDDPAAHSNARRWRKSYPATFDVEWEIANPFCLTEGVVNGNIYESVSSLRGDVLRGALAGLLKRYFDLDTRRNRGMAVTSPRTRKIAFVPTSMR